MGTDSTQPPVEVPALVYEAVEYARARGADMAHVDVIRSVCRRRGRYYASAWIGNHQREYLRGVACGFVAAAEDEDELLGEGENE